jgi:hypothetical protein
VVGTSILEEILKIFLKNLLLAEVFLQDKIQLKINQQNQL